MRRNLIITGIALATLLIAGSIAWASIPGPDGVIHGCYKTSNPGQGGLIVVDSAASCPSGFTALNWRTGFSGYEHVQQFITTTWQQQQDGSWVASAGISCPTGKKVLGGGGYAFVSGIGGYATMAISEPSGEIGWELYFRRETNPGAYINQEISVHALCAFVS